MADTDRYADSAVLEEGHVDAARSRADATDNRFRHLLENR
jgi:hypothetical protein